MGVLCSLDAVNHFPSDAIAISCSSKTMTYSVASAEIGTKINALRATKTVRSRLIRQSRNRAFLDGVNAAA
jgi:hypothetical protein